MRLLKWRTHLNSLAPSLVLSLVIVAHLFLLLFLLPPYEWIKFGCQAALISQNKLEHEA